VDKIRFRPGLPQTPWLVYGALLLRGWKGEGKEEGNGRGREGKGKEREGPPPPLRKFLDPPWNILMLIDVVSVQ